jgi:hypothetical protein
MKKIVLFFLLAFAANLTVASETVVISNARYTKYSDPEVREFISKMHSIQPDMTVDQVLSIMGRPLREQLVQAAPPQRVLVYPLSIVISTYQSSRTGQWLVSAPALYGSPLCQREDGVAQRNAIGVEVTDYPSVNCIPRKFGPPQTKSALSNQIPANWELLATYPGNASIPASKNYYDAKNIELTGEIKKVRTLSSFASDIRNQVLGTYRSNVTLTWVSCDPAKIL